MTKNLSSSPESVNLCDFILFLSVMKNKKAYQNVLSIILEEPDIQIREVKVEQVVLNKSGKRAIRLDAWAVSEDKRQFNMEMENHSEKDFLGKRTRYKQLTEVKASEEWEDIRMTIYDMGIEKGKSEGLEFGIRAFILDKLEENVPQEKILTKLQTLFQLDAATAIKYYQKYSASSETFV